MLRILWGAGSTWASETHPCPQEALTVEQWNSLLRQKWQDERQRKKLF